MAVEGSRKRASNVGHQQYGRLITLEDGTTAFQPSNAISDAEGNGVNVSRSEENRDNHSLNVRPDNALSTDELLNLVYRELRLLNIRFEEAFDTKIPQLGTEDLNDEN